MMLLDLSLQTLAAGEGNQIGSTWPSLSLVLNTLEEKPSADRVDTAVAVLH